MQDLELAYLTSLVVDLERQNSEAFLRVIGALVVFLATAPTPLWGLAANGALFNSFLALHKMWQFRKQQRYLAIYLTWKVKYRT